MVEFVRTYNPEYAQQIEMKKENYLAFLKYPEEIRRHIYTTNIVESINSGIELMRLFYNVLHNFREKPERCEGSPQETLRLRLRGTK
jgi:transposase-like protein